MSSTSTNIQSELEAPPPPVCWPCSDCGHKLKARAQLAGKKVRCPKCRHAVLVPANVPVETEPLIVPAPTQRFSMLTLVVLTAVVTTVIFACAIYANLSFVVKDRANYKYFPPFRQYHDANDNRHLGAEYYNIAKSMVAGEGFSSPWNNEKTGPTAWMPPVMPTILAGLLLISGGDRDIVMAMVIALQVYTLIGTGLLVLLLVRQTTMRIWAVVAAALFIGAVVYDFRAWFQQTHDCWLILMVVDLLIAGFCWFRPLDSWKRAICWGLFGGLCALTNPIVAMGWGVLSLVLMIRQRAWYMLGIAALVSMLTISPWIVRNYLVFGRLFPVKSNAAYELWQSQCKQKGGVLHDFNGHPFGSAGAERQEYKVLGEMKFVDKKKQLFWESVRADPLDFADRVAARFFAGTLWYTPFSREEEVRRPTVFWIGRIVHPLPFLALIALIFSAFLRPLHWSQWVVIGVYLLYLMPYVGVSYYERYAVPLLAAKVLLVIWTADRLLSIRQLLQPAALGEGTES